MIKRQFKKMWDSLADFFPLTRADRRHWYVVDRIAALEKKVEELEEANRALKSK